MDKNKYEITQRRGKHILVVKNIAYEDEGHYSFQVRGVKLGASLTCTSKLISDSYLCLKPHQ